MKVIKGRKGKGPPPTPEERARKQELKIQGDFIKNIKKLNPDSELLNPEK